MSSKITGEKKRSGPAQIIGALRTQMKLHQALGINEYPAVADLDRFLKLTKGRTPFPAGIPPTGGDPPTAGSRTNGRDREDKLCLLRQEMTSCTSCYLHGKRLGSVVGSGSTTCRVMVVGDWSQQKESHFSEVLFGPEEDTMLWKMMAAIKLKPESVFGTNCVKCCPCEGVLPDSVCEKSCFSFLEREIGLVKPGIICAMGELAARTLTGSLEPLSRLRGKFFSYRYVPGIKVIPTYHPHFLLQNREMKRATWLDLQAVEKRLRLM